MLKRKNRLNLNKDFDYVFKNSHSFYNDSFGAKVVKNDLNLFRLGILIGVKVSKKAVVRNKIKRQLREIIRKEQPNIKEGYDLVIIALPQIVDRDFGEIKQLISVSLHKLKLYKEKEL